MSRLILFNKPYGVVCQFSADGMHTTLKEFIPIPDVYPAGRLDTDSEGLLILTDDGKLQQRISNPKHKWPKIYWVQVEGIPGHAALDLLAQGVDLGDCVTRPAHAKLIDEPTGLWPRDPPIRWRKHKPTQWLELTLREGKNRQIRRMTAKVGFSTLRLIRYSIGAYTLKNLAPGTWREASASAAIQNLAALPLK